MTVANGGDFCDSCEKTDEEKSVLDEIWLSTERPLLPLKPLQKSRSCTNIVQSIKGFSIRKTSTSKRFSSPDFQENAFTNKRERCTSEVDISEDSRTNDAAAIEDQKIRSASDALQFPFQKNVAWYHPVNAREASKRLLTMHQNGAFLIRPASNPTPEIFHTLCVVFAGRVYNFHLRNLKNGYISLGNRSGRKVFPSMLEMIKYHQNVPISIYLEESDHTAHVLLLITPSK